MSSHRSSHLYVSIVSVVHTCVTMDPSVGILEAPQVTLILPILSTPLPHMMYHTRQSIPKAFVGSLTRA